MTRARNMADLLDSNGDVKSGALDNVPPSNDASALTTGTLPVDRVPYLGRRNLIINGAMQVAQRATSETGLSKIGFYTVDRLGGNSHSVGSFGVTDEQSTDAPTGFSFSRKLTFTTAQTTSSGTRNQVRYHPEGYDVAHLEWGTANAKTVTLSFWVKSSVTGNMAVSFINSGETHSYVSNYTINASNTWEYKTITVSGPTVGTWATDNATGIRIAWDLGSGSTYEDSSEDTWVSGWYYRTSSSVRPAETLNATWQITGVQLEVGSVATPFEHRSYGEELALCQRYFQKSAPQSSGLKATSGCVYTRDGTASSVQRYIPVRFVQTMRTTPSATIYDMNLTTGKLTQDSTNGRTANISLPGDQGMMVYGPAGLSYYADIFGYYLDAEL